MRARIRALSAVLAILGLVAPTGAVAQAPPSAEMAAAQARTAVPPGGNLPLSLDEAVARALENNVDIAVERYNPEQSAQDVIAAEGYYDPFLFANVSKTSTDTKGTNFFSGGDVVNNKTGVWNFGLGIPLKTGAEFSLGWNNNKRDTTNAFTTFNPVYNSNLSINITQPLLKGFKVDAPRNQLRLAKKSREISDVQFRQTIINTVAGQGYYELLFATDNLAAARTNLDLAKRLLGENEIRVKVGTMAPLDVVTAQSEVAARETNVILAENALAEAEDDLKRAIFPQNDPAMWSTRVVPTDGPPPSPCR
jgi:outer membrane protein TolC